MPLFLETPINKLFCRKKQLPKISQNPQQPRGWWVWWVDLGISGFRSRSASQAYYQFFGLRGCRFSREWIIEAIRWSLRLTSGRPGDGWMYNEGVRRFILKLQEVMASNQYVYARDEDRWFGCFSFGFHYCCREILGGKRDTRCPAVANPSDEAHHFQAANFCQNSR